LDEFPTDISSPETITRRAPFPRPADHYASADSQLRPILPRAARLGCGWASVVFVALLFAAGTFAPRAGNVIDLVFRKMQDEVRNTFTKDVTPAQRAAFDAEMNRLRGGIRSGGVKLDHIQPLMKTISEVSADEKVDHGEADRLIAAVHQANAAK
jgi:hypothetical protein